MIFKKQTVSYPQLVPGLQTGDIVLMHGRYVSSHVIETIENSDWSHAAIVLLAKDFGFESSENVLLWESNLNTPVQDVLLKKTKDGPQLVSLHERMKRNFESKDDSKFAVRHLYYDRTPAFFETFQQAINAVHSAHFPSTKEEMEDPIKGRYFNIQTSQEFMFCSELVAYTYIKLGLLSDLHPTNSYIPADFSEHNSVGLLKRAFLGNEIIIDPKSL
jgi:hypothetical protein